MRKWWFHKCHRTSVLSVLCCVILTLCPVLSAHGFHRCVLPVWIYGLMSRLDSSCTKSSFCLFVCFKLNQFNCILFSKPITCLYMTEPFLFPPLHHCSDCLHLCFPDRVVMFVGFCGFSATLFWIINTNKGSSLVLNSASLFCIRILTCKI